MTKLVLLGVVVGLMGCNAATLKVTKLVRPGEASKGIVYRLPEPAVQVTTKQYKTMLYKDNHEYSAAVVAVPSDNYVYEIQQIGGTITKDGVAITLGDGGILSSYNLTSAQQATEIIKQVGTLVASIAAAAAAAPPKGIILRADPTEEELRLKGYYEDRRERTLKELDHLKRQRTLTSDQAKRYQDLVDQLAILQQKLTPELNLVTDVQVIPIEIVRSDAMSMDAFLTAWQKDHANDGAKRPRFVAVARQVK
jgi:hypothetical protein